MKQGYKLSILGIKAGDIGPFVEIAVATCQRQIVWLSCAAMLASDNMLDVESHDRRYCLRQPAVFASVTSSAVDQEPQFALHYDCLRSWERAFACNTVITSTACK